MRFQKTLSASIVCLLVAGACALTACSGGSPASSAAPASASAGSATSGVETTVRLVDLLGALNAAYVGHDEADQCVVYAFGTYNGRPLAVLLDKEGGAYRCWIGASETSSDATHTITDDLTGEVASFVATQNAGGTLMLRKEGISGTATLVSCYGTESVEANIVLYDEALLDYELSYLG
jgi:hypothetical protein